MNIKDRILLALTRGDLNLSVSELADVSSPKYEGMLYDVRDAFGQSAVVSIVVTHTDLHQLTLLKPNDAERERGHAVPASIYLGSGVRLVDPNA